MLGIQIALQSITKQQRFRFQQSLKSYSAAQLLLVYLIHWKASFKQQFSFTSWLNYPIFFSFVALSKLIAYNPTTQLCHSQSLVLLVQIWDHVIILHIILWFCPLRMLHRKVFLKLLGQLRCQLYHAELEMVLSFWLDFAAGRL